MAGWRLKGGMPEWHEVCNYKETLRNGPIIEAYTEDCDGDAEYWGVKENGILVAYGACPSDGSARALAERVICYGATAEQRQAAAAKQLEAA